MLPVSFETPRLLARMPVPADAAAIFAGYTADPTVARYMMWVAHAALAQTEAFIARCIAMADDGSCRSYVLAERERPDAPIGMLEARPNGHRVDLGYVLARSFWGRGYMPEAVAAVAALALADPGVFRVQAFCDVDNVGSRRTLEKAGFACEGRHERFVVHPNVSPEPRACFIFAKCR